MYTCSVHIHIMNIYTLVPTCIAHSCNVTNFEIFSQDEKIFALIDSSNQQTS